MKVSILVPIYNVELYIKRCIISLFEQTYNDIEFIFVNDCTKDKSIEILNSTLQQYPQRWEQVKIISHKTNKGLAAARTTALQNATGDYVMHVDSDDFLNLDAVEKCVNLATLHDADIVACGINHIYDYKNDLELPRIVENKIEYINKLLNRKTPVNLVAQFTRKDIIKEDSYPIIGLNFGEDYVTTTRIAYYANKIVSLDSPIYNYWHGNQQSYTNNISRKQLDDVLRAYKIIEEFYESKVDYCLYTKALQNALFRNIVLLLILCNNEDIDYLISLNVKRVNPFILKMAWKHKLMYILYCSNCKFLIKIYKSIGLYLQRHI